MTINKSQGQTFTKVGVYLPNSAFSHDQLYVTLSRLTLKKNLKILLADNSKFHNEREKSKLETMYIQNIVFHEIL